MPCPPRAPFALSALFFVALIAPGAPAAAMTQSVEMIVRECEAHESHDTTIQSTPGASGPEASHGTLPGVAALPAPALIPVRAPLQPEGNPSTYPARTAVRLDLPAAWMPGGLWHACSGTLIAPSMVLTAAHCVLPGAINLRQLPGHPAELLWRDSIFVRPGLDHGHDQPGIVPTRVARIWVPRDFIPPHGWNHGADWAILALAAPIGRDIGWTHLDNIEGSDSGRLVHVLSYPREPVCVLEKPMPPDCDTIPRSDTLFHSVSPLRVPEVRSSAFWIYTNFSAWKGESGSGLLLCDGASCDVRGIRVFVDSFLGIDSVLSGAIAEILRTDPALAARPAVRPSALRLSLRIGAGMLQIASPRPGALRILDVDGRSVYEAPGPRAQWNIPSAKIRGGLRIVVVQGDGVFLKERIALP